MYWLFNFYYVIFSTKSIIYCWFCYVIIPITINNKFILIRSWLQSCFKYPRFFFCIIGFGCQLSAEHATYTLLPPYIHLKIVFDIIVIIINILIIISDIFFLILINSSINSLINSLKITSFVPLRKIFFENSLIFHSFVKFCVIMTTNID